MSDQELDDVTKEIVRTFTQRLVGGLCVVCGQRPELMLQVGRAYYALPCQHRQGIGSAALWNQRHAAGQAASVQPADQGLTLEKLQATIDQLAAPSLGRLPAANHISLGRPIIYYVVGEIDAGLAYHVSATQMHAEYWILDSDATALRIESLTGVRMEKLGPDRSTADLTPDADQVDNQPVDE